eukprot:scaffold8248_cov118-Isochrysis_galbana.AAC.2
MQTASAAAAAAASPLPAFSPPHPFSSPHLPAASPPQPPPRPPSLAPPGHCPPQVGILCFPPPALRPPAGRAPDRPPAVASPQSSPSPPGPSFSPASPSSAPAATATPLSRPAGRWAAEPSSPSLAVLRFAGLTPSLAQAALLHLFRSRNARFHSAFFIQNALGRPTGEAFVLTSAHVARSFPRRLRLPPPGAHAPCATSAPLVLVIPHSLVSLQEDHERRALVGRWVEWPGEAAATARSGPAGRGTWGCHGTGDAAPGDACANGGGGGSREPAAGAYEDYAGRLGLGCAGSEPAASPTPRYGLVGDRPCDYASAGPGLRMGGEGLTGAAVGVQLPMAPVSVPLAGGRPTRPRPIDRQLVRVIRTTPTAVGDVCRPPLFHPADKAPASAPPPPGLQGPVARGLRASASHPFFWRSRAHARGGALIRLDRHATALARLQCPGPARLRPSAFAFRGGDGGRAAAVGAVAGEGAAAGSGAPRPLVARSSLVLVRHSSLDIYISGSAL